MSSLRKKLGWPEWDCSFRINGSSHCGISPLASENKPKWETSKIQEDDTYDLQKELEAKFDELFGPLDD